MNSTLAFEYLIAVCTGRKINAAGAAEMIVKSIGTVTTKRVVRGK
jgi:hypothetical protein